MIKKSVILVVLSFLFAPSHQQRVHPLCGTDGTREHVADPASCHSYLHCRWDTSSSFPVFVRAYQLDCRTQGSTHFEESADGRSGECIANNPICSSPTGLCPAAPAFDIMIANYDDDTCTQHRPCRLTTMPWTSCTGGLVFNRNTGTCDSQTNAPCNVHIERLECPGAVTGFFPGRRCHEYIYCYNGIVHGVFNCSPGHLFNEAAQGCVIDDAGVCPQSEIESNGYEVPRVKNRQPINYKKMVFGL